MRLQLCSKASIYSSSCPWILLFYMGSIHVPLELSTGGLGLSELLDKDLAEPVLTPRRIMNRRIKRYAAASKRPFRRSFRLRLFPCTPLQLSIAGIARRPCD